LHQVRGSEKQQDNGDDPFGDETPLRLGLGRPVRLCSFEWSRLPIFGLRSQLLYGRMGCGAEDGDPSFSENVYTA
jgi:hypothetical protein